MSLYVLYSASCYGTLYVYFCAYRAPNQALALPQPNLLLNCIVVVVVVVAFCYIAARHFCEFANFFFRSLLLLLFLCSVVFNVHSLPLSRERVRRSFSLCCSHGSGSVCDLAHMLRCVYYMKSAHGHSAEIKIIFANCEKKEAKKKRTPNSDTQNGCDTK